MQHVTRLVETHVLGYVTKPHARINVLTFGLLMSKYKNKLFRIS